MSKKKKQLNKHINLYKKREKNTQEKKRLE